MRIGFGNDIHRLEVGRPLLLGGVEIPFYKGAAGHSDGDALLHAITDAVLGALAAGDIGSHFPDADEKWENADSTLFLKEACRMAADAGYEIGNIDSTISLEMPKVSPHLDAIRGSIANIAGIGVDAVSVKAKTAEGIGRIGNGLAVRAEAVVLLSPRG